MSKKRSVLLSLIGAALFIVSMNAVNLGFCGSEDRNCWRTFDDMQFIIGFFPAMLIVSLITYKMHDDIFRAWMHFVYWWVLLHIFIVFTMPDQGSILWTNPKETFALVLPFLFFAISFVIVGIKWYLLRKK